MARRDDGFVVKVEAAQSEQITKARHREREEKQGGDRANRFAIPWQEKRSVPSVEEHASQAEAASYRMYQLGFKLGIALKQEKAKEGAEKDGASKTYPKA